MKLHVLAASITLTLFASNAYALASDSGKQHDVGTLLPKSSKVLPTFNVMAPLSLDTKEEWTTFANNLTRAKAMGVHAVSVDVWWGKVEKDGDQVFDWAYYHKIARLINSKGLQWVPIMSFHQCGGNVGDRCDIPLPAWLWTHFKDTDKSSLMFKSEEGNYAKETLSFFVSDTTKNQIYQQYSEFMLAFQTEFADYASVIQEINISMGPAGELRYPSYNSHDENSAYPSRGAFQSLSAVSLSQWQSYCGTPCSLDSSQLSTKLFTKAFSNRHNLSSDSAFAQLSHEETPHYPCAGHRSPLIRLPTSTLFDICFMAGIKKPAIKRASSTLLRVNGSLTVCYSRMRKPHTTIAANTFHF